MSGTNPRPSNIINASRAADHSLSSTAIGSPGVSEKSKEVIPKGQPPNKHFYDYKVFTNSPCSRPKVVAIHMRSMRPRYSTEDALIKRRARPAIQFSRKSEKND